MLVVPEYDRKSYQKMFEESRAKIPTYTSEWTDFNLHDPGITILQLFAWLFEMQHYYADFIGEAHQNKYLRLLGCERGKKTPSRGLIQLKGVERDFTLPRGAKFLIDSMVYETLKSEKIICNEIAAVYRWQEEEGLLTDLTPFVVADAKICVKPFLQEGDRLYIGFKKILSPKKGFNFYIHIGENPLGYERPKFNLSNMKPMGVLKWEIYTPVGWQEIKNVQDETVGFLKSGRVTFQSQQNMRPVKLKGTEEYLYYIRCTLISQEYDFMPRLARFSINSLEVIQRDTKAISIYLDGDGRRESVYETDHYLGETGIIQMFVKTEDGRWQFWKQWEGQENRENRRRIKMNTAFAVSWNKENIPPKGTLNIRLICYDKQFFNDRLLGEFNSALSPQFTLDFEKIDEESLRMDVKHEEMGKFYLTSYNRVDNLCEWGPSDKVYETEGQQVIFGDKIHGRLPADMNNQLMITGFAYSSGKNTVVSAGSICQAVGNYEASWGNIEITTLEDTIEGSEEETVAEAMERFNEYFNQKERMVTQEEYISYIKNTPGLLIHKVKVISQIEAQGQKEAENQICLLVQPYGEETHPALSSVYKEMILNHIEPVRLLTSEILVEGPIYIGIYVRVKICRKKGYDSKMIEEAIYKVCQEKIDSEKTARNFGESISYSELFQSVQQVDGVLYMEELILKRAEDEVEINNYCSAKDITCHYNELTYLEKLEIQID